MRSFILSIMFFGLFGVFQITKAQKLPNKQEHAIWVSGKIKVDGKAKDWGNQYQAYNKATNTFYSIANDKDNLYLIIRITDKLIARKAIAGGISFSVVNNKKLKGDKVMITYPKYNATDPPFFPILTFNPDKGKDSLKYTAQVDSARQAYDRQLYNMAKQIGLKGVTAIADTVLSIYNDEHINAIAHFDDQLAYVYELSIPIKYLDRLIGRDGDFYYQVRLNGYANDGGDIRPVPGRPEAGFLFTKPDGKSYGLGSDQNLIFPTDFGSECILAKKP